MKRFLFVFLLVPVLVLSGCNDEVFVDPLEASQDEFRFGMLGGAAKLSLSHGDWMIGSITVDGNSVPGTIYREGDKVGSPVGTVYMKGLGKVVCDGTVSFTVSRPDERSLNIEFGQSFETEEKLIEINLENDYGHLALRVTQDACSGYELDRIEYGDIIFESGEGAVEVGWKITVNNTSDGPLTMGGNVFKDDVMRRIYFPVEFVDTDIPGIVKDYETLMEFTGGPFYVPLPDSELEDGELHFSGETVPFGYSPVEFPLEFENEVIMEEFPPGETTMAVYLGYYEYYVGYTLYFKHPGGGRPVSFSGQFRSKTYNGEWFRIFE